MTILRAYSWERGDIMIAPSDYGGQDVSVVATDADSFHGSRSLRLTGLSNFHCYWRLPWPSGISSPSTSFYIRGHANVDHRICYKLNDGNVISLQWNTLMHTYDAYINEDRVAEGSVSIPNATGWRHVSFYVIVADAGSIQVNIDGYQSINYSGDTKPGSGTDIAQLEVARRGKVTLYVDSLVMGYGELLGAYKTKERIPDSDVSVQFTPSVGADNYEMVNASPANDAEYNSSNSNGEKDILGLTTLSYESAIACLVPWVRAQSEGAGNSLKVGLVSNNVEASTERELHADWGYYMHAQETDPDTGTAWTESTANAAQLLYEHVVP